MKHHSWPAEFMRTASLRKAIGCEANSAFTCRSHRAPLLSAQVPMLVSILQESLLLVILIVSQSTSYLVSSFATVRYRCFNHFLGQILIFLCSGIHKVTIPRVNVARASLRRSHLTFSFQLSCKQFGFPIQHLSPASALLIEPPLHTEECCAQHQER